MEEKYKKAITAGAICGTIMIVLSFISNIVMKMAFGADLMNWANQFTSQSLSSGEIPAIPLALYLAGFFTLVLFVLGVLTFLLSGMLASRLASAFIKNKNEAVTLGVLSGVATEVVHRPFAIIFTFIMSLVQPASTNYYGGSEALNSIIAVAMQIICCLPVTLVAGVILAALGAWAYAAIRLKI